MARDENGQPRTKRARIDATAYGPCPYYRRQGDMQLLAKIRDHKKRFLWPQLSSPRARSPTSDNGAMPDITTFDSPRRQNAPSRGDTHEPIRSPAAPDRARRHASPPDLPRFNANDQQDHRFDVLGRNQQYVNIGVDQELLEEGGSDEDEEEEEEDTEAISKPPNDNSVRTQTSPQKTSLVWLSQFELSSEGLVCWHSCTPDYIANADNNTCQNNDCEGALFDIKILASGRRKRESRLTYPCVSIIAWLRRVFAQPGMAELPISLEEWAAHVNMDTPLGDITYGWAWRSTVGGMERIVNNRGNVEDRSIRDLPVRFSNLPYGISFSMNIGWFQSNREGNYLVGACYLVINNLPRHLRFLRKNICLALVMTGPKEPNDYALDQMLGPLIEELLELKQGGLCN
ncbi:unnamed protein product [Rhizoctonia solani]|uniref:Uncharacterized protein n=1 Tax=Rhizoctonia solani TaxID=456999 RepID=A0A8H2WMB1_9AGAM|nr:unnamed protein product [Rhizoctonia solani]